MSNFEENYNYEKNKQFPKLRIYETKILTLREQSNKIEEKLFMRKSRKSTKLKM